MGSEVSGRVREDKLASYFSWDPCNDDRFASSIVGAGHIGGKGRSLLFGMKSLLESGVDELVSTEMPESIFISIEIFDKFLSQIDDLDNVLDGEPEEIERRFLAAELPNYVRERIASFLECIDSPIAVRSSSMLEDSLKYSFAGKYRSRLLHASGDLNERVLTIENEIKRIYARTFFPTAVEYRNKHNLGDDKMGIIVMRASGKWRGRYYFPTTAGVGYSLNLRRWCTRLNVEDGLLRLVFGLGTMSTRRGYARIFSLSNPNLRPEGNHPYNVMRHSQESFQMIDGDRGDIVTYNINDMGILDYLLTHYGRELGEYAQVYREEDGNGYWENLDLSYFRQQEDDSKVCITFERFTRHNPEFFTRMQKLLKHLEDSMGAPVDIEFAYEPSERKLELLQARPLWTGCCESKFDERDLEGKLVILKADRMVTDGQLENVPYLVYVDHKIYVTATNKHEIARAIGEINKKLYPNSYILVAPGRVGSSNPALGVPVQYSELTNCKCIVEVGIPVLGFMPELSYGTHFYSDLEIDNVLYMPVFAGEKGNVFREEWFESASCEKMKDLGIKIYKGSFDVYMDCARNIGIVAVRKGAGDGENMEDR
ncbi:MAG: PEP/pyruvate-binding domain-containing protein [Acetomicrobium sp.]